MQQGRKGYVKHTEESTKFYAGVTPVLKPSEKKAYLQSCTKPEVERKKTSAVRKSFYERYGTPIKETQMNSDKKIPPEGTPVPSTPDKDKVAPREYKRVGPWTIPVKKKP